MAKSKKAATGQPMPTVIELTYILSNVQDVLACLVEDYAQAMATIEGYDPNFIKERILARIETVQEMAAAEMNQEQGG